MNNKIISRLLRFLVFSASFLCGLIAGVDADRYIVQVPAWRKVEIDAWAIYSRNGDLGNGLIFYPFLAIVSALLLIITIIIYIRVDSKPKAAFFPMLSTLILSLSGLFFTALAAPQMLSLVKTGSDPEMIRQVFEKFHFWGLLRGIVQVLSFASSLWILAILH